MSPRVRQLIKFGLDNNLEIVSHGLAPNPFGFCFESHGKASDTVKAWFHKQLESLSPEETKEVIKVML